MPKTIPQKGRILLFEHKIYHEGRNNFIKILIYKIKLISKNKYLLN
jgi:hypothetical protein